MHFSLDTATSVPSSTGSQAPVPMSLASGLTTGAAGPKARLHHMYEAPQSLPLMGGLSGCPTCWDPSN